MRQGHGLTVGFSRRQRRQDRSARAALYPMTSDSVSVKTDKGIGKIPGGYCREQINGDAEGGKQRSHLLGD